MKLSTKLQLTVSLVAGLSATAALADPAPYKPSDFLQRVTTKEQAAEHCAPKAKVAMACKDCKNFEVKGGEDKAGILGWFAPDSKHNCGGCGGKITLKASGGGRGPTVPEYTHTCSKCGDNSAYVCTDHKKH